MGSVDGLGVDWKRVDLYGKMGVSKIVREIYVQVLTTFLEMSDSIMGMISGHIIVTGKQIGRASCRERVFRAV